MTIYSSAHCKLADNCVRCMHGIGHPPLVALYDRPKGTYSIAEGAVCVARWASSGHAHGRGDLCGAEATVTVAGIDLCPHHADRLQNWRYFEYPEERVRQKTDGLREAGREYEAAVRASEARREQVNAAVSLVYYIRRTSDGAVKIGTTRSFGQRMADLRGAFGELQVLLTESGTMKNERLRHGQFAAYRIGRTEWFVPAKTLLAWIESRRGDYGMRRTQQPGVMPRADLHRLVVAAPADRALEWRGGKVLWPGSAAQPADSLALAVSQANDLLRIASIKKDRPPMANIYDRWHKTYPKPGERLCDDHGRVPTSEHGKGDRWQLRWKDGSRQVSQNFQKKADAEWQLTHLGASYCLVLRCGKIAATEPPVLLCAGHRTMAVRQAEAAAALKPPKNHESVVYFARNGDRIKIGRTTNLDARLMGLCLPRDAVILTFPGGQREEKALHYRFHKARIGRSEWFEIVPEIEAFIAKRLAMEAERGELSA